MKHTELFLCECHSPEHQFIVRYWDDAKEVYVGIHLTKATFWQRVWYAIKYIFGYQCKYGAFDEIILNPEDAERLQKVVDHLRKCDFPGFEDTGVPGKDFVPVDWVETLEKYGKWKIVQAKEEEEQKPAEVEQNPLIRMLKDKKAITEDIRNGIPTKTIEKERNVKFATPVDMSHTQWSEDERIRRELVEYLKGDLDDITTDDTDRWINWLEKQKEASKAIETVERIDKYIDEHLANAHDMKDSNPDKKYYRGCDDALAKMSGILQDVYSGEKQKEHDLKEHDLVAQLKEHLANTPKEQLEAEWKELEKWNHVGHTVEEDLGSIKPEGWSEEEEKMMELVYGKRLSNKDGQSNFADVRKIEEKLDKVVAAIGEIDVEKLTDEQLDIYSIVCSDEALECDEEKHKRGL